MKTTKNADNSNADDIVVQSLNIFTFCHPKLRNLQPDVINPQMPQEKIKHVRPQQREAGYVGAKIPGVLFTTA